MLCQELKVIRNEFMNDFSIFSDIILAEKIFFRGEKITELRFDEGYFRKG